MEKDILYKIRRFLTRKNLFDEECHVVYFLVEIRKFLDRLKENNQSKELYSLLRFYCDWIVHTSKIKITPEIKDVMEKIDKFIPKDKKKYPLLASVNQPDIGFVYMDKLRMELEIFLRDYKLPKSLVLDEDKWSLFIQTLTKVLVDQPILNPIENIESFYFEISMPSTVIWTIKFKDERGDWRSVDVY